MKYLPFFDSGGVASLLHPIIDPFVAEVVLLIICLVLSAFFSGSESALFSLTKADIHRFSRSASRRERAIHRMMEDPQKILVTILIGNLFVNLMVSMLSTKMLLGVWKEWGHVVSIAILTPLVVIFCEITPKTLAINSYQTVSKRIMSPMLFFHAILYPVRLIILLFTGMMIRLFDLRMAHRGITKEELNVAVRMGEEDGIIGREEGSFIKNVLRFSGKEASNVMFPRNSAVFLPFGATVKEAMKVFIEAGVIRAPVYRDDLDHVVGMIDSRDLLPAHLGYRRGKSINRFIREISFFPASRDLHDLLGDFLAKGIQMAVVVDEYGGTAGVVTLNKLLSEILGRDMTKWEDAARHEVRRMDDRVSIISGEMQIEDFNHVFEARLESRNTDSVGGYLIEVLSRMPRRGDTVDAGAFTLRVRHVRRNKIESIEVIRAFVEDDPA